MSDQIKQYDVFYVGGGKNANGYKYRAEIGLRAEDGSLLGKAYFHRDKGTLPTADTKRAGYTACHYMAEDFPRVLDLLRKGNSALAVHGPSPLA